MVELKSQPTPDGSTPRTEKEIFDIVLGVRPGYAMGLGHGVVATSSRLAMHTTCDVRVREANERAAAANDRVEQAIRKAVETQSALATLQDQMTTINARPDLMNIGVQSGSCSL